MKISNFLIKFSNKLNLFFKRHFGKATYFREIVKFIMSIIFSLKYYYYIADFGFNKILVLTVLSILVYIGISFILFFTKYIVILIKRMRSRNIALYILLFLCLYEFLDGNINSYLDKYLVVLVVLFLALIITVFAKGAISFFRNKEKKAFIFFLPSLIILISIGYFLESPGFDIRDDFNIATHTKTKSIETDESTKYFKNEYKGSPVDLNRFVNYSGNTKKVRDFFFNKDLSQVPVKGEIYFPKKDKAPILFIVHGNHRITEDSYKGYDYLCKYLAKRGIAAVSIDMNMLNGFMKFSLSNENDARAIMILENIKYILKENKDKNSELYNKIDTENIAILGHSRGGEAAAISYNYNNLNLLPEDGNKKLDYNFNIKGIIAVAPTFDQYSPSEMELILKDTNYLTIAGTHDADLSGFEGMLQYDKTYISKDDKFKSAVYVGFANHGNFNNIWGDFDLEPIKGFFLNRRDLLKEDEQRKILSLYTYGFLENIFGIENNRELFKEGPQNYIDFPNTNYYTRYMDGSFKVLANYDEDYNISTATTKNSYILFNNLSKIYESAHDYGDEKSNSSAVFLNTRNNSNYSLNFREKIDPLNFLTFDLGNLNGENASDFNMKIRIQDTFGEDATLNVKDLKEFDNETIVRLKKLDEIFDKYSYNSTPVTVRMALSDFKNKNQKLNLEDINKIEFIFTEKTGKISLDNIGFSN